MGQITDLLAEAIKSSDITDLAAKASVDRSHLYKILKGKNSPSLDLAEKISQARGLRLALLRTVSDDQLFAELNALGAPLAAEPSPSKRKSPNSILLDALIAGRRSAAINSILPITLWKNAGSLDWDLFLETADTSYLGYLLDIVCVATADKTIIDAKNAIPLPLPTAPFSPLIHVGVTPRKLSLMKLKQNLVAEKWHFYTLDTMEANCERFKKWQSNVR
jgi:transcriptional regulator with XRE-family HTH domain